MSNVLLMIVLLVRVYQQNRKKEVQMKKTQKNILAVAGVISTVLGIMGAVPAFLQEKFGIATGAVILVVAGLVLIAIAFGD